MKSSPKVARRSGRSVRKVLADGTIKVYRYGPHRPQPSRFSGDTIGALIQAYKASPEWAALASSTRGYYTSYLRDLERNAEARVADVRRRDIMALRDAIATTRGSGAAAGFVRASSALFGWAVDREWIEHTPCQRVRPPKGGTLPAWTAAQVAMALATLPEPFRRAVLLAAHTGQRRGDLVALRWSDYDGQALRFRQQKTGRPMVIPASAELQAELAHWCGDALTLLADEQGRPWVAQRLTERLNRALVKIGLPGLSVHGVRKFVAADLADRGATTHEIAAITGHKTLGMVQHYTTSADQARLAGAATVLRFTTVDNRQPNLRKPLK
jgi:integrase